jgi:translation initiation factor 2 alpha subunit (eIF-2alpha)
MYYYSKMYQNSTPSIHEIVFARLTKRSGDMGNYVELVEYDNIEGLVLCTEITKWKSNLKSIIKNDEIFPLVVIDIGTGIDLSYSKVKNQSRDLLKSCYEYQNKIYELIIDTCKELNISDYIKNNILESNLNPDIYTECVNSDTNIPKNNFDSILKNPNVLFEKNSSINTEIIHSICNNIKNKIKIKPYHTERDFKLCVFDNNSLAKLKEILFKIKNLAVDNNFELSCKSSPNYQLKIIGDNIDNINELYQSIEKQISSIIENYNASIEFQNKYVIIKELEIVLI